MSSTSIGKVRTRLSNKQHRNKDPRERSQGILAVCLREYSWSAPSTTRSKEDDVARVDAANSYTHTCHEKFDSILPRKRRRVASACMKERQRV